MQVLVIKELGIAQVTGVLYNPTSKLYPYNIHITLDQKTPSFLELFFPT